MLQGVGAGTTHKHVCLLASLQVLGGEDLFLDPRQAFDEESGESGKPTLPDLGLKSIRRRMG
jgi:hypothetical protein